MTQKNRITYEFIDPNSELIQFLTARPYSQLGVLHLCKSVYLVNHTVGITDWAYIYKYGDIEATTGNHRLSLEEVLELPELEPEVRLQLLFNLDLFKRK